MVESSYKGNEKGELERGYPTMMEAMRKWCSLPAWSGCYQNVQRRFQLTFYRRSTHQKALSYHPHHVDMSESLFTDLTMVGVLYQLDAFFVYRALVAQSSTSFWIPFAIYFALYDAWEVRPLMDAKFKTKGNSLFHVFIGMALWLLLALMGTTFETQHYPSVILESMPEYCNASLHYIDEENGYWRRSDALLFSAFKACHGLLRIVLYADVYLRGISWKSRAAALPRLIVYSIGAIPLIIAPILISSGIHLNVAVAMFPISYMSHKTVWMVLRTCDPLSIYSRSQEVKVNWPFFIHRLREWNELQLGACILGLLTFDVRDYVHDIDSTGLQIAVMVAGYILIASLDILSYSTRPPDFKHHALARGGIAEWIWADGFAVAGIAMLGLQVGLRYALLSPVFDSCTGSNNLSLIWLLSLSLLVVVLALLLQQLTHVNAVLKRVWTIKFTLALTTLIAPLVMMFDVNAKESMSIAFFVLLNATLAVLAILFIHGATGGFRTKVIKRRKMSFMAYSLAVVIALTWLARARERIAERNRLQAELSQHLQSTSRKKQRPKDDPDFDDSYGIELDDSADEDEEADNASEPAPSSTRDHFSLSRLSSGSMLKRSQSDSGFAASESREQSNPRNWTSMGRAFPLLSRPKKRDPEPMPPSVLRTSKGFSPRNGDKIKRVVTWSDLPVDKQPQLVRYKEIDTDSGAKISNDAKDALSDIAEEEEGSNGNASNNEEMEDVKQTKVSEPEKFLAKFKEPEKDGSDYSTSRDGSGVSHKITQVFTKTLNKMFWETPKLLASQDLFAEFKISWSDLFLDIIYVGAVFRIGDFLLAALGLGVTEQEMHPSAYPIFQFACVFMGVFSCWWAKLNYTSKCGVSDVLHKLIDVFQGFIIFIMAACITSPYSFIEDGSDELIFAIALVAFHGTMALLWSELGASAQTHTDRYIVAQTNVLRSLMATFMACIAVVLVCITAPQWITLSFIGFTWLLPLLDRARWILFKKKPLIDETKLELLPYVQHRMGDLTLLCLGEGIIQIIRSQESPTDTSSYAMAVFSIAFLNVSMCRSFIFKLGCFHHDSYAKHVEAHDMSRIRDASILVLHIIHSCAGPCIVAMGIGLKKIVAYTNEYDRTWSVCEDKLNKKGIYKLYIGACICIHFCFVAVYHIHRTFYKGSFGWKRFAAGVFFSLVFLVLPFIECIAGLTVLICTMVIWIASLKFHAYVDDFLCDSEQDAHHRGELHRQGSSFRELNTDTDPHFSQGGKPAVSSARILLERLKLLNADHGIDRTNSGEQILARLASISPQSADSANHSDVQGAESDRGDANITPSADIIIV